MTDIIHQIRNELKTRDVADRARLLEDVVRAFYDFEKFDRPGGEGLDGRYGPAREGVAKVLDAAVDYKFDAISQHE